MALRRRQQEASESGLSDRYTKKELPSASSWAIWLAKTSSLHLPPSVSMAAVTTGKVSTALVRSWLNHFRKKSCSLATLSQLGLLKSGTTKSPNMASK